MRCFSVQFSKVSDLHMYRTKHIIEIYLFVGLQLENYIMLVRYVEMACYCNVYTIVFLTIWHIVDFVYFRYPDSMMLGMEICCLAALAFSTPFRLSNVIFALKISLV